MGARGSAGAAAGPELLPGSFLNRRPRLHTAQRGGAPAAPGRRALRQWAARDLEPPGRAPPAAAWSLYRAGCSLRLCPQAFSTTVWQFLAVLQEQFEVWQAPTFTLLPPTRRALPPTTTTSRLSCCSWKVGKTLAGLQTAGADRGTGPDCPAPTSARTTSESRCCRRCWNLEICSISPRFHSPSRMPMGCTLCT